MNRRYVVAAMFLGIAACATPSPESPVPVAKVETAVISSDPTAAEGAIEYIDVPDVPKAASTLAQASSPGTDRLVCTRERITGSHRVTRVCRTPAEIESRRRADQAMIDKLRAKPAGTVIRD